MAQTLFSSLVQDYVRAHGWGLDRPEGRMVALIGDAELDEGNIFECMLEGWKQGLRNCWWIVDYNRQSLDAVIREGLWQRYEQLFRNFGWDVVILKYGSLLEAAFREPGGDKLRQWIDRCPNQLYSALVFQGGAAWRKHLNDDLGDQGPVTKLIESRSDEELARLMTNLAGHDLPDLAGSVRPDRSRPAGLFHLLHHQGLRPAVRRPQGQSRRPDDAGADGNLPPGDEYSRRPRVGSFRRPAAETPKRLQSFLDNVPFAAGGPRRLTAPRFAAPDELAVTIQPEMSTQTGFGALLNELAREKSELVGAHRHHVAGRDRLDQSRRLGQPPRPVRARGAGRHVQKRAHPVDVQLGFLRQGPAHRARHCRE